MKKTFFFPQCALQVLAGVFLSGASAHAANFTVTNTADTGTGSLRAAIALAQGNGAANDTIVFDATAFAAPRKTITLSSRFADVTTSITITAPTAGVNIVSTNGGVFVASGNSSLSLTGLNLRSAAATVEGFGGTVLLQNCTLSGGSSAIRNQIGSVTAQNCTLTGNATGVQVLNNCLVTLKNCTVALNTDRALINNGGFIQVSNSLVAVNARDNAGTITNNGNNIFGGTVAEAGLDPNGLQENGGPTPTIALTLGSRAINAGDTDFATDQRGTARPQANRDDIGAFELVFTPVESLVVTTATDEDNNTSDARVGTGTSLREAINFANANGTSTDAITFSETAFVAPRKTITVSGQLPGVTSPISITAPAAGVNIVSTNDPGGLFIVGSGGDLTLTGLTINSNTNGVFNVFGTATVQSCTITGGDTGIINFATTTVQSSTIANGGTGISTSINPVTVQNSTISGNDTGISNPNGTVNLANSIVAGNDTDISGAITDNGFNLLNQTAAQAGLDPNGLAENGGPTRTIALIVGSLAINAGDPAVMMGADQRGLPRVRRGRMDSGAFEVQNDQPSVSGFTRTLNEDSSRTLSQTDFTDAFTDPNDTLQKIQLVTVPANGTLRLNGTAVTPGQEIPVGALDALVYVPNADFFGNDPFTFNGADGFGYAASNAIVTLQVLGINDLPRFTIGADQTVNEDAGAQSVANFATSISAGAGNESGQKLTFIVLNTNNALFSAQPTISANGTLTYTPAPNASGSVTVLVVLKDNGGLANGGQDTTISQTFTIVINPVNDAPTISAIANQSTNQNTVTAPISFTIGDDETAAAQLTVTAASSNTLLVPDANIVLGGTNPNRTLTITPVANQSGSTVISVTVSDGALQNSAQFTLQVLATNTTPVNTAPVANEQTVTVNEDTPRAFTLTGNDIEGNALTFALISGPKNGALSGVAPNLIYTPNSNFNGVDSFAFRASDGVLSSQPATIKLQVLAVNDAPVAIAQQLKADNATPLPITLSATDSEDDALDFAVVDGPQNGTLEGTAPNLIYQAQPGFRGIDQFTFLVSDGTATSQATIQIVVAGDAAVSANDDSYNLILGARGQAQQNGVVLLSSGVFQMGAPGVLRNDSFPPDSRLTVRAISNPSKGRFQLRTDGTLFYVPNSGQIGRDEFTYAISDGKTTATARVRLNIIDQRAPELTFDTPRDRETVSLFTVIKGRVRDRNAGVKSLTLLWKRFDGAYWNGSVWTRTATELPLNLSGINWVYQGKLPAPGTNRTTDLLEGSYQLRATATDNSGNVLGITNRVLVKNAITPTASAVRLSSAAASAAQDTIVLSFTGVLQDVVAIDGDHYALKVNGVAVGIGNADYSDQVVTLSNLELSTGDAVELQISGLQDAEGKVLAGGTIQLIAR